MMYADSFSVDYKTHPSLLLLLFKIYNATRSTVDIGILH